MASWQRRETAAREFFGVFFWVTTSLLTLILCNSTYITSRLSSSQTPFSAFLVAVILQMSLWETLGLHLGSTLNPAVSLCLSLCHQNSGPLRVQLPSQFLGHFFGVAVTRIVAGPRALGWGLRYLAPPAPVAGLRFGSAIIFEAAATGLMCASALLLRRVLPHATVIRNTLMIGVVVAIIAFGANWTGSCMNPAMSLALAVFDGSWHMHSVYWIGPVLGAMGTAILHNALVKTKSIAECPQADLRVTKKVQ